jgi:exodeoxyribonuclease V
VSPATGRLPAKLVCLRNNHASGLLNGSLWTVETVREAGAAERMLLLRIKPDEGGGDADNSAIEVVTHPAYFCGGKQREEGCDEFDYGYALTVHKAQGAQWGSVTLLDESACFRENRARWLYTGITRAAERITVVVG